MWAIIKDIVGNISHTNNLNIARERARLGGDWAIAGVILTAKMREIAR